LTQLEDFKQLLNQTQIQRDVDDLWVWKDDEQNFTVKSAYYKLKTPFVGENSELFNIFLECKGSPITTIFLHGGQ